METSQSPLIEYRAMFHLSHEPMALLGLDARFWDVNQALADMVLLQPQQLCSGLSLLSLVMPEDLDTFLHHARSLLGGSEGVEPCHLKFPCRIRNNDDAIVDVEFDLHMLRRVSSPYCFALYIRPKSTKSEPTAPSMAQLDAGALQLNPAMFLLGSAHEQQQQQQQQQLAAASGNAFMLGSGAQQDGHASMFLLGDYQQQQQQLLLQQHSNMFMMSAAHDAAPPHSGGFT